MPDRHLLTREAFIEGLKQQAPLAWPAIWGSAYAHIEACLQAAYVELERLLAIPEMHRTRLKREMKEVLRLIAEEGPARYYALPPDPVRAVICKGESGGVGHGRP